LVLLVLFEMVATSKSLSAVTRGVSYRAITLHDMLLGVCVITGFQHDGWNSA
jgi:hypothetical protein